MYFEEMGFIWSYCLCRGGGALPAHYYQHLRKRSQGPRIEELLEAALVSPAGCVLTSGRGRCAVCRAGFQGEVVFAVLAIQDFEFGTLPWHLFISVKFRTCVQNWDFNR